MKTGLVLEGGAKRGIYTAGVLDVFLENGIKVDGVVGVSAGAIHGCSYVSEQIGRSIRYYEKYNDDYRFMSWKSFFKTGDMVDEEFAYHELPEKLDVYDNETFMKSKTDFYATCTNVETGEPEYLKCIDMFKDIDVIRASASMPFVSRIVETRGLKLLDGGISDGIPLKKFQEMGYKCVVVQTRPDGYRKKPNKVMNFLAKLKYGNYPNFIKAVMARYKSYNDAMDYIEEEVSKGEVITIQPSKYIKIGRMEPNFEIVKAMYELGRQDALAKVDEIKKFFNL